MIFPPLTEVTRNRVRKKDWKTLSLTLTQERAHLNPIRPLDSQISAQRPRFTPPAVLPEALFSILASYKVKVQGYKVFLAKEDDPKSKSGGKMQM